MRALSWHASSGERCTQVALASPCLAFPASPSGPGHCTRLQHEEGWAEHRRQQIAGRPGCPAVQGLEGDAAEGEHDEEGEDAPDAEAAIALRRPEALLAAEGFFEHQLLRPAGGVMGSPLGRHGTGGQSVRPAGGPRLSSQSSSGECGESPGTAAWMRRVPEAGSGGGFRRRAGKKWRTHPRVQPDLEKGVGPVRAHRPRQHAHLAICTQAAHNRRNEALHHTVRSLGAARYRRLGPRYDTIWCHRRVTGSSATADRLGSRSGRPTAFARRL